MKVGDKVMYKEPLNPYVYTVSEVDDDEGVAVKLLELPGVWFPVGRLSVVPEAAQTNRRILGLLSAMNIVKQWNDSHATGLQLGIEPGSLNDGGSEFFMAGCSTNNIATMFKHVITTESDNSRALLLQIISEVASQNG